MRRRNSMSVMTVVVLLLLSAAVTGRPQVTIVTGERQPYIGSDLPAGGYVHQVVTEAFQRAGYAPQIRFVPWARASATVQTGKADGIVPVYRSSFSDENFVYSDPFPGSEVGLLKRVGKRVDFPVPPENDIAEALTVLGDDRVGVVRGGVSFEELGSTGHARTEAVSDQLQNIDKLARDRIQYVLIDRFVAADLLVAQRPHLIGQLEFMQPPLARRNFHIAFTKENSAAKQIVEAFNRGLASMRADGKLDEILAQHGLFGHQIQPLTETRLNIATVNNPDMLAMRQLTEDFEKQHPDIELEWTILDENTLRHRLLSDLAIGGGQYDVMTIGAYETPIWADRGWIYPLTNIPKSYDLEDVLPSVRKALSHNDQIYALPFYVESSMTFYRRDLFLNANVEMPKNPSYRDIERLAQVLHQPDKGIYGICLRGKAGWGENMAFLTTLINAYGGRWFNENWQPQLTAAPWQNAVAFYVNLLRHYGPPSPANNGYIENLNLFATGQCAIWIDATVAAGHLFDPAKSRVHDKLGFAAAPHAVTTKGSAWLWAWSMAIPATSKQQTIAKQFVLWATSKDYVRQKAAAHGWVSVPPATRLSTYATQEYQQAAPFADFVLRAIEQADPQDNTLLPTPYVGIQYVAIPEFPAIGNQVGQLLAELLTSDRPVVTALAEAQEKVRKQMEASGYLKPKRHQRMRP